jgi:hypothetical protein
MNPSRNKKSFHLDNIKNYIPDPKSDPLHFLEYVQSSILSQKNFSSIVNDVHCDYETFIISKDSTTLGVDLVLNSSNPEDRMFINLSMQKLCDLYKKNNILLSYTLK